MGGFGLLAAGAAVLGGDLLSPPATTGDGDFTGETLELLIPLAEGGGTDTWARFIGTELTHALPGQPGFAPTNEAGGEGITGSNHFFLSARDDATELLVSTATTVVPWVLGRRAVKYDFAAMIPVLANGTGAVVYARTAAGVNSVDDLGPDGPRLRFGGITATGLDLTTLVAFDLLGWPIDAVFGFEGRGPVNLALQRGEIDLDYQTTASYASAVEGIVKDKSAVLLFSLGQLDEQGAVIRDPNFPDTPTVLEVYRKQNGGDPPADKLRAYSLMLGLTYTYQKALWVPSTTLAAPVETLRSTADTLGKSQAFIDSAKKVLGGYPLDASPDLRDRIAKAYQVDETTQGYLRALLKNSYKIIVD
jgi:tripartite-type tricarboxylate transporter receptor subunit TctC